MFLTYNASYLYKYFNSNISNIIPLNACNKNYQSKKVSRKLNVKIEPPIKFMLDSNIFDALISDNEFRMQLNDLIEKKAISLFDTAIQCFETTHQNILETKLNAFKKLRKKLTITTLKTIGIQFSKEDEDDAPLAIFPMIFPDPDNKVYKEVRGEKSNYGAAKDATIAQTCVDSGIPYLVTINTKDFKRISAQSKQLIVINYLYFKTLIDSIDIEY